MARSMRVSVSRRCRGRYSSLIVSLKRITSCVTRAYVAPQRVERDVPHVDPVDTDGTEGHVVEPQDQIDERRLSDAALAHYSHGLIFVDAQVDVLEHHLVFVLERDALKSTIPWAVGKICRIGLVGDLRLPGRRSRIPSGRPRAPAGCCGSPC